mmetsp:Transcript_86381/g.257836  ORF Transcript_86381/g.257836 Transcript_86381/m.257836 type:complete len:474 (-) Transcript_86381:201-1622(-)
MLLQVLLLMQERRVARVHHGGVGLRESGARETCGQHRARRSHVRMGVHGCLAHIHLSGLPGEQQLRLQVGPLELGLPEPLLALCQPLLLHLLDGLGLLRLLLHDHLQHLSVPRLPRFRLFLLLLQPLLQLLHLPVLPLLLESLCLRYCGCPLVRLGRLLALLPRFVQLLFVLEFLLPLLLGGQEVLKDGLLVLRAELIDAVRLRTDKLAPLQCAAVRLALYHCRGLCLCSPQGGGRAAGTQLLGATLRRGRRRVGWHPLRRPRLVLLCPRRRLVDVLPGCLHQDGLGEAWHRLRRDGAALPGLCGAPLDRFVHPETRLPWLPSQPLWHLIFLLCFRFFSLLLIGNLAARAVLQGGLTRQAILVVSQHRLLLGLGPCPRNCALPFLRGSDTFKFGRCPLRSSVPSTRRRRRSATNLGGWGSLPLCDTPRPPNGLRRRRNRGARLPQLARGRGPVLLPLLLPVLLGPLRQVRHCN